MVPLHRSVLGYGRELTPLTAHHPSQAIDLFCIHQPSQLHHHAALRRREGALRLVACVPRAARRASDACQVQALPPDGDGPPQPTTQRQDPKDGTTASAAYHIVYVWSLKLLLTSSDHGLHREASAPSVEGAVACRCVHLPLQRTTLVPSSTKVQNNVRCCSSRMKW